MTVSEEPRGPIDFLREEAKAGYSTEGLPEYGLGTEFTPIANAEAAPPVRVELSRGEEGGPSLSARVAALEAEVHKLKTEIWGKPRPENDDHD
jgi:hypothetical protein